MIEIIFWILVLLSVPYIYFITKGLVRWSLEALFPTKSVTISYTGPDGTKRTQKVLLKDSDELRKVIKLARRDQKIRNSRGRSV